MTLAHAPDELGKTMVSQQVIGHGEDTATEAPRLVQFVIRGLDRCWMPELGRWSHSYLLEGARSGNVLLPHSDVFYTLNCVLGLSRVPEAARRQYDLQKTFDLNARLVPTLPSRPYAYGMVLWAAAANGFAVPADMPRMIVDITLDERRLRVLKAQDLGILLTGCLAQVKTGDERFLALAQRLFAVLKGRFVTASGLFLDSITPLAGRFSSFATHVYLAIGAYSYGEHMGDRAAIDIANAAVETLIDLQGPNGEWPWYYYSPGGRVVDLYDIYSVHQHGMAPALLEFAERNGVLRAAAAREKGFGWILGRNDLGVTMLRRAEGLIIRSQARKGELEAKQGRALRAAGLGFFDGRALAGRDNTVLRLECRSYELGWTCWSFGDRDDLRHLSDLPEFA